MASAHSIEVSDFTYVMLTSALLITQFRLWDDLADRHYDASEYPDRILVRCVDVRPLQALLLASIAFVALSLWKKDASEQLTLYCGLILFLAGIYGADNRILRIRAIRVQCVLAKYPVFVVLLTPFPTEAQVAYLGIALYVFLSIHEWHDFLWSFCRKYAILGITLGMVFVLAGVVMSLNLARQSPSTLHPPSSRPQ